MRPSQAVVAWAGLSLPGWLALFLIPGIAGGANLAMSADRQDPSERIDHSSFSRRKLTKGTSWVRAGLAMMT